MTLTLFLSGKLGLIRAIIMNRGQFLAGLNPGRGPLGLQEVGIDSTQSLILRINN